jgi:hypothetical protein
LGLLTGENDLQETPLERIRKQINAIFGIW